MIKKWMRPITKAAYFMGVVFLLTGMLLSAVNLPVQAGSQSVPEAKRRCPIIQTDTACSIKNNAITYVYTIKNNYSDKDAKYNTTNNEGSATFLAPGATATITSSSNSLRLYVWEYGQVWHNGYPGHSGHYEYELIWSGTKDLSAPSGLQCTVPDLGVGGQCVSVDATHFSVNWAVTNSGNDYYYSIDAGSAVGPTNNTSLTTGPYTYAAPYPAGTTRTILVRSKANASVTASSSVTCVPPPPVVPQVQCIVKDSSGVIWGAKIGDVKYFSLLHDSSGYYVTIDGARINISADTPECNGNFTGSSITVTGSGNCTSITATATNTGDGAQQWGSTYTITLPDGSKTTGSYGPLAKGASATVSVIPTTPGTYTIQFQQEPGHPGDTENGRKFEYTLTAQQCQPAAPSVSGSCALNTPGSSSAYITTWTVTNNDANKSIQYSYNGGTYITIAKGGTATFTTNPDAGGNPVSINWTWDGNTTPLTIGPVGMTGSCPKITVTPKNCAVGSDGKIYNYEYSSTSGVVPFTVSEDGQTGIAIATVKPLSSASAKVTLVYNGVIMGTASGAGLKCTPITLSGKCTGSYPNYQANWTLTNLDDFGYSWTVTGDGGNTYPSVALPATTTIVNGINEVATVTWTDSTGDHPVSATVDYYKDCTQPQADIVAGSCYTQDTSGTVYYKFTYTANVPFIIQGEPGTTYPAGTGEIIRNNPKVTIVYGDNKTDDADATNMTCSYQPIAILSGKCTGSYPNYKAEWTVSNPDHVAFTWLATVGETGSSSSVDSHTSFISNFSLYTDEKATISWVDAGGNHTSAEVTASFSGCKLPTLTVTPKCYINSDATTQQIQWLVTSTDYTGSNIKYGSTPVTLGTAFYVPASVGAITVTYDDVNNVTGSAIPTDLAPCGKTLTLTAGQCSFVEGSYRVDWTVTNPNEFNVPFGWTSNNPTGNGSGTAALNNTASFNVPYSGTGTLTVGVSAFGAVSPASQTITPACPKITVVPPQDMTICSLTATSFIPKFTATYENISTDGASLVITSSLNPGVPATTSFTGSAVNQTVAAQQANWAGIGDGLTPFTFTWDYLVYLSGTQVGSGTVTYSYDAQSDQELCQQPQELLILDPYCTIYNGDWAMAWEVKNPNPWAVPFSWVLDGDGAHAKSATAAASAMTPLEFISLGDAHMVNISWTDGKGIAHTASLTDETKKCETPKEPTPESTPQTFLIPVTGAQPTLAAPQTEGALLIPVTGADYQPIQFGGAFFTNLYTHLGLFFVGLALVLTGIQKKFLK